MLSSHKLAAFLPRDATRSAFICHSMSSVRPSIRPPVCLSVHLKRSGTVIT